MAIEKIKVGGFVSDEVAKINANFTEVETNYAKKTEIPSVPTKTSELTNDSGFITSASIPTVDLSAYAKTTEMTTAINSATANLVTKETGKGLSTNDYTNDEKTKLANLRIPTNKTFTTANWTSNGDGQYVCTIAGNGVIPLCAMRSNSGVYSQVLADVAVSGTNIIITADETFEGYVVCI